MVDLGEVLVKQLVVNPIYTALLQAHVGHAAKDFEEIFYYVVVDVLGTLEEGSVLLGLQVELVLLGQDVVG